MKFLVFLLLSLAAVTGCPRIDVEPAVKVTLPEGAKYFHPRFNPSGEILLLSAENYKGLYLFEPATGKLVTISGEEGAGYSPVFSSDGEKVYYTENEYIGNLRHITLKSFAVAEGQREVLQPPVRTLSGPVVSGNAVLYTEASQLKSASVPGGAPNKAVMVSIEDQNLVLYAGGQRKILQPYPGESYIWPSVSPAGNQIVAFSMGKGAFICDLEGNLLADFGQLEAPVWAGDKLLVGMETTDDGHNVTSSVITMVDTETSERTPLSPEGLIAMHPSVSVTSGQVAFHTPMGEIYRIRYQVKK
jgi:Tol biopolymer transport system component